MIDLLVKIGVNAVALLAAANAYRIGAAPELAAEHYHHCIDAAQAIGQHAICWMAHGGLGMLSAEGGRLEDLGPDDGNADDQTVMAVPLPRAVAPGETIEVYLEWTAQISRTTSTFVISALPPML